MKKLLDSKLVIDFVFQGRKPMWMLPVFPWVDYQIVCGCFLPGSGRAGISFGERLNEAESGQVDRACYRPCHVWDQGLVGYNSCLSHNVLKE